MGGGIRGTPGRFGGPYWILGIASWIYFRCRLSMHRYFNWAYVQRFILIKCPIFPFNDWSNVAYKTARMVWTVKKLISIKTFQTNSPSTLSTPASRYAIYVVEIIVRKYLVECRHHIYRNRPLLDWGFPQKTILLVSNSRLTVSYVSRNR